MRLTAAAIAIAIILGTGFAATAQASIVDEWASVQPPQAPLLKPVQLDPKTTALLVLDFMNQNCGTKARCIATEAGMAGFIKEAQAAHATIIYSITRPTTLNDIVTPLKPKSDVPYVKGGPDKFLGTNLDAMLKNAGIQTVIVTGTAAEGAVISTASGAAFRGMKVVLPVDGMSSGSPYAEQYVTWGLLHSPGTAAATTATTLAQISFDKE